MPADQLFELFAGCVVGNLDQEALAAHRAKAEVFDRRINHVVVWDRDQRVIRCTDPRAAEADVLYCAFTAGHPDVMPDAERLLDHDQHRAEEIGETVPSRKRYGQTSDTQSRQHRIGRETQLVGPLDQESSGNDHADEAHAESDELAVQAALSQMLRCHDDFGEKAGGDHGKPGGTEIQRARLHIGDDDAPGPPDPEYRAEQWHREGCHENDRQRRQESWPAGARDSSALRPARCRFRRYIP